MKIGVLGAGQLGRMLALAGIPMGHEFVFYTNRTDNCAASVGEIVCAEFDDEEKLSEFSDKVDLVTVEFENIPISTLSYLSKIIPVYPSIESVETASDRLNEKSFFGDLKIPVANYHVINTLLDLDRVANQDVLPVIIKTRRQGYDGKGQAVLAEAAQVEQIWKTLGEVPMIAEERVSFERELSIIAVRNVQGDTRYYPLCQNYHKDGILIHTQICRDTRLQQQAEDYASRVLEKLNYVGVLTIEFFDCNGTLIANEMAPRVHNSGHWTIDAAITSQFENHIRAILGQPLGETAARNDFLMYNLISHIPERTALLAIPNLYLHDYNKSPAPGRKLGHITISPVNQQAIENIDSLISGI